MTAAHGFKPECGHTEPRRGAEWWGEAFCLLLRSSKVSRRKGGTISSRYPNNGYVHRQTAIGGKPPPTLEQSTSGKTQLQDRPANSGVARQPQLLLKGRNVSFGQ
ncbi:hypothetical protein DYL61_27120 [Pseudomonas nabeulensis]|uniref:Uncharacterized protein n=1 Tax=Pseudomonas nabeulensis TaxID=2293833 RepID=A0A4Z0ALK6_9PSED|nr:hypothetical protein DYL61_27120 [Pseudomonas nabeulensis]